MDSSLTLSIRLPSLSVLLYVMREAKNVPLGHIPILTEFRHRTWAV